MDKARYERMRQSRVFLSWSKKIKDYNIRKKDQILVYLYDKDKIMAEYDVEELNFTASSVKVIVEPIYNAPPVEGVGLDDLILVQLTTYDSIPQWRAMLKIPIVKLNKRDYKVLTKRLTG